MVFSSYVDENGQELYPRNWKKVSDGKERGRQTIPQWTQSGCSPGHRRSRFEGDCVRIRRTDQGVLLQPLISDAAKWFEELDRFDLERCMVKGRRNQPITPRREIFE
jgi:virulence-associated protein VagC